MPFFSSSSPFDAGVGKLNVMYSTAVAVVRVMQRLVLYISSPVEWITAILSSMAFQSRLSTDCKSV